MLEKPFASSSLRKAHMIKKISTMIISGVLFAFSISLFAVEISGSNQSIQFSALPKFVDHVLINQGDLIYKSPNGQFNNDAGFKDGRYSYQIVAQTPVDFTLAPADSLNNGRSNDARQMFTGLKTVKSGSFMIDQGQVVNPKESEKAR